MSRLPNARALAGVADGDVGGPWAIPTACAAAPSRVRSSVAKATRIPWPTSPMTFAAGKRTPSRTGEPVGEPLIPSLCSRPPIEKPGRSASTRNAVARPLSRSVSAKTT
jgi:hypothetical protein